MRYLNLKFNVHFGRRTFIAGNANRDDKFESHSKSQNHGRRCRHRFRRRYRNARLNGIPRRLNTPPASSSSSIKGVEPAPAPPIAKAPFDAATAKQHQQAWAKHLGTTVETTNGVGAKMILIPPGEFLMGSSDEQVAAAVKAAEENKTDTGTISRIQKAERPQHRVVITKPFLMGATEVTVGQFRQFVEATKYQTEAEKYGFGDSSEKGDRAKRLAGQTETVLLAGSPDTT